MNKALNKTHPESKDVKELLDCKDDVLNKAKLIEKELLDCQDDVLNKAKLIDFLEKFVTRMISEKIDTLNVTVAKLMVRINTLEQTRGDKCSSVLLDIKNDEKERINSISNNAA